MYGIVFLALCTSLTIQSCGMLFGTGLGTLVILSALRRKLDLEVDMDARCKRKCGATLLIYGAGNHISTVLCKAIPYTDLRSKSKGRSSGVLLNRRISVKFTSNC